MKFFQLFKISSFVPLLQSILFHSQISTLILSGWVLFKQVLAIQPYFTWPNFPATFYSEVVEFSVVGRDEEKCSSLSMLDFFQDFHGYQIWRCSSLLQKMMKQDLAFPTAVKSPLGTPASHVGSACLELGLLCFKSSLLLMQAWQAADDFLPPMWKAWIESGTSDISLIQAWLLQVFGE